MEFSLAVERSLGAGRHPSGLARSAVSLAVAKLGEQPEFGSTPGTPVLTVPGLTAADRGLVVFDPVQSRDLGVPYSLNNLTGTAARAGSLGNTVAKATVHIVATGYSGGQSHRVETVLALPPFPFAVASSGPIKALGGVEIAGIAAIPSGGRVDDAERVEADLVSNDPSVEAVFLGANTRINGSVQAVGNVKLDGNAPDGSIRIKGSVKSHADGEAIPSQQLTRYDPIVTGDTYTNLDANSLTTGSNQLGGRIRHAGSLEVSNGLKLDGCLLYVDGDLKISGGLQGKGALVVTGKIEIQGQSRFDSGNGLAILSGKDTVVSGSGSEGSFLQGLIYTQGRFSADHVTVLGNLIADNETARSPVSLTEARVLMPLDPVVRIPLGPPPTTTISNPQGSPLLVQFYDPGITTYLASQDFRLSRLSGGMIKVIYGTTTWTVPPSQLLATIEAAIAPGRLDDLLRARLLQRLQPWLEPEGSGASGNDPSPGGSQAILTFDPSSFLKIQERMRVVLWREDR